MSGAVMLLLGLASLGILGGVASSSVSGEDTESTQDDLVGTEEDDTLTGDSGSDLISGNEGNDLLRGGQGEDTLNAGEGDDTVSGNADDDMLYGEAGYDLLNGGDGDDEIFGGSEDDTINGDAGEDSLFGDAGNDSIHGDDGDDNIFGGAENDSLWGDDGADYLIGETGDDSVSGGDGNDILIGDQNTADDIDDPEALMGQPNLNLFNSNALREVLSAAPDGEDDGNDSYYGGAGDDLIYDGYSQYDNTDGTIDYDLLEGGEGDDRLYDFDGSSTLNGGDGDDVLVAVEGFAKSSVKDEDASDIDEFTDILRGGNGNDTLIGDDGDTLQGGAGEDTFRLYIDSVISDNGQHLMIEDMATIDDWEEGEKIIIDYDPFHHLDGSQTEEDLADMQSSNENLAFYLRQEEEGVSLVVWNYDQENGAPLLFVKHVTIEQIQDHLELRQFVDAAPGGQLIL
ncbi:calcium-binding protein [Donghicola sp. C2-DW-16]|uniref:Calcium-binding protein n=1 Tax=Donghicola mangrovi TaxID=2729614 RepID=A0ABX2PG10_9RHOB|nr:calcium-binding protein [Donghicola mangrovi]NVO27722.1 calcium-binding protein [Donghicola mangrovi]